MGMSERTRSLERYLMQADKLLNEKETQDRGILVDDITESLGMMREDGREYAQYLHDCGWARVSYAGGSPRLELTYQGHKMTALVRRPSWRRWIDDNPIFIAVLTSVISGLIVLLGGKAIDFLLKR